MSKINRIFAFVNTVIEHIEYLTRVHDCVAVPGLGAFIAQYESARISDDGSSILPPSRTIVFNGALTHNDGLLVNSVARRSGIHYEDALTTVKAGVSTLMRQLEIDGEVSLGLLGMLVKEADRGLLFVAAPATDRSGEFAYLRPVEVKEVVKIRKTGSDKEMRIAAPSLFSPLRAVLKVAASLAVFVALGLCLTTPVSVKDVSLASMGISSPEETLTAPVHRAQPGLMLVRLDDGFGMQEADTAARNSYRRMMERIHEDRYVVVVASLPSKSKAEDYIAARGGSPLQILESDGRFRVYAATAATANEAYAKATEECFASRYPDSWVYRMK